MCKGPKVQVSNVKSSNIKFSVAGMEQIKRRWVKDKVAKVDRAPI